MSCWQLKPGLECSVEAYGKLLGVRGEKRLMGVWKEMGWDGMNMELAEKIYKRKVGPERLACVLHSPRLILCVECRRIFSRRCSKRRRSRCARALPRSLLLLFLLPPLSKRACSQPRTGSVGHVVGEGSPSLT